MTIVPGTAVPLWVPLVAAVVALEIAADVAAKESALRGGGWWMAVPVALVIAGNVSWQYALRMGVGLARAGILYAVGVALGAALIGVIGYGEEMTARHVVGAVLGVVVLLLLG